MNTNDLPDLEFIAHHNRYNFGKISNNYIYIWWIENKIINQTRYKLVDVVELISKDVWIITKTSIRKKKLKQLKNEL